MGKRLLIALLLHLSVSVANGQWVQTSGPSLGHVNQFCRKGDTLYAAMGDYGIGSLLRSVDSGRSWKWLSFPIPYQLIMQTVAHDGVALFAGARNALYVSTDEGASWRESAPAVSPQAMIYFGGAVYYGGVINNGVKRTFDHGLNWSRAGTGLPSTSAITQLFADGTKLYAGSNGDGLFVTEDSAKSWHSVAPEIPHTDAYITAIGRADSVLFVSTPSLIYRSTDQGSTWQTTTIGLPTGNGANALYYSDGVILAGLGSYGNFRSTDLGNTWSKAQDSKAIGGATAIAAFGQTFVIGSSGVFRSPDGGLHWAPSDKGVGSTYITSLLATSYGVLAGDLDADFGLVWSSTDHGQNWSSISQGLSTIGVNALAQTSNVVLAGTDGSGMFRSEDSGKSWTAAAGFPANSYVTSIAASGNIVFAGTNGFSMSLFRSKDAGATWESSHNGLSTQDVTSLLWNGDRALVSISSDGFFSSTDQGNNWTPVNTPSPFAILLGKFNSTLFAGDFNKLYRSMDDGASWQADSLSLAGLRPKSFTISGTKLYVGTTRGIFRSDDSGRSFVRDGDDDLAAFEVPSLASRAGWIYAGTDGAGVWAKYAGELAVSTSHPTLNPIVVNPNPSNGYVHVNYSTKSRGDVRIEIVDELGVLRKALLLGEQLSGEHTARIEFSELLAGHYFCRILSGTEVMVGKIELERH